MTIATSGLVASILAIIVSAYAIGYRNGTQDERASRRR
jgi:hypothetical protein